MSYSLIDVVNNAFFLDYVVFNRKKPIVFYKPIATIFLPTKDEQQLAQTQIPSNVSSKREAVNWSESENRDAIAASAFLIFLYELSP